jgi:hypothetical protein
MQWAARDGVAAWFFQTYAWSGGLWYGGNHVEQYKNGVIVAGGEVDLCRSVKAEFGQWRAHGGGGEFDMATLIMGEDGQPWAANEDWTERFRIPPRLAIRQPGQLGSEREFWRAQAGLPADRWVMDDAHPTQIKRFDMSETGYGPMFGADITPKAIAPGGEHRHDLTGGETGPAIAG